MKNLNHQHLFYFWHTVRHGSMLAAAQALGVSQPTISAQIAELEKNLGKPVFERLGKSLRPTDFGELVAKYAEEIFSISNELMDLAQGKGGGHGKIRCGVVDVIPKNIAFGFLKTIAPNAKSEYVSMSISEGSLETLLSNMSARGLDFVLSDAPLPPESRHRVFSRKLRELPVCLVSSKELAHTYSRKFPHSLHDAPILLPKRNTQLRRNLDLWFHEHDVHPNVVAEFDDSALMKEFARAGYGLMPIAGTPHASLGLHVAGKLPQLLQPFFLLFPERRQNHPAIKKLVAAAATNAQNDARGS